MSMKKIREMQEWVAAHAGDVVNERLAALAEDALAEVDAIEQAAKALESGAPGVINDRAIDAWLGLGETIANETVK